MRLRELIQPIQEVLGLAVAFDLDDLGQAVDKDMGNIIIAGVQTADKALQSGVAGDLILAGLDQLCALFSPSPQNFLYLVKSS